MASLSTTSYKSVETATHSSGYFNVSGILYDKNGNIKNLCNVLACFVLLTACNNEQMQYYDTGELHEVYRLTNGEKEGKYTEYYRNGNTRIIHHFNQGVKVDSSIYFKKDGSIKAKDFYVNGQIKRAYFDKQGFAKIEGKVDSLDRFYGVWKYYNKEGWVNRERDFFIIEGKTYLNQEKFFDENGEIILGEGDYFVVRLKQDTTKINKPIIANGLLISQETLHENYSSSIKIVLPKTKSINFNHDFSNVNEVETDTIHDLNIEKKYRELLNIKEGSFPNHALFGRYYSEVGEQDFRGIIVEYFNDPNTPDSLKNYERKYYFDIPVYVKDTIDNVPDL